MAYAPFRSRLFSAGIPWVLALRRMLMRCANALVPAGLPIYEMTAGVAQTQTVATFVALGLPQALGQGPQTLAELSAVTGVNPEMLARFLRLCHALTLVHRQRSGTYRANAVTRALHPKAPGNMAAFATYMASKSNVNAWGCLTGVVQTGVDGFRQTCNQSVWDYLLHHPSEEAVFAQAMVSLAHSEGPAIAQAYPFARHRMICDVGGGRGAIAMAILHAHPTVRGIVLDQPSVVVPAQAALPPLWMDRLSYVSGNFFEAVPKGCDAYLLRHILHDWDDAACAVILGHCRDAMGPQSRLLIVDSQVEPQDPTILGALKDITMAVVCGGKERSRAGMQAVLENAGLQLVRVWPTAVPVVVWEARVKNPDEIKAYVGTKTPVAHLPS